jgi:hypothetical protein
MKNGAHWCVQQAKLIAGCYRRDEAHDPEIFAAALAVLIAEYPENIISQASDPRCGIVTEFPNGLPNIGQIKTFLDNKAESLRQQTERQRRITQQLSDRQQAAHTEEQKRRARKWQQELHKLLGTPCPTESQNPSNRRQYTWKEVSPDGR